MSQHILQSVVHGTVDQMDTKLVFLHSAFLREGSAAHVTVEWFLARVVPNVSGQ